MRPVRKSACLSGALLLTGGLMAALSLSAAPVAHAAPHKIMVILGENHSRSQVEATMPYLTGLGNTYGHATAYHAISHPSLPNYFAIWGGSTFGVTTDCSVGASGCVPTPPSVWGQTIAAGGTAKAYQESMTSNCQTGGSTNYAPRHGPWPYWTDSTERAECNANDVPMGTTTSGNLLNDINGGSLPVTGEMTPNLCNDGHDCTNLSVMDGWLQGWIPKLMAGPDYQAGNLTIIVTFDEDDGSQGNTVVFDVIDPRLSGTTVTATGFNHYALTKWLDDNAGVSDLRNAATAGDLRAAFGLGGATQAAPSVTSFSPASGPVGTSVGVTGSNFTGATAVKFNGTAATFTVNSDTSITATVPSGATTGPVSVTGPGGTGTSSSSFTVTTTQAAPSVTTGAASAITSTSATVSGTVNPNGADATCHFQYGQTTNYGGNTATVDAGAGTSAVPVSGMPSGLASGALYHYRITCTNSGGTSNGSDATFTTSSGGGGGTGSATLNPTADSYVSSGQSSTNYGTANPLSASATSFRAMLKFHTAGVVPAGSTITSVTLSLFNTNAPSTTGGYEFHPESDTWTETGLTWSNQPTWNTTVLATSGTPTANASMVTTLPNSAINTNAGTGGGNTDFGARYTTAGVIEKFSSREDAANPPKLTINYSTAWTNSSLPLRAAFYYPWYPETWTQNATFPATHYTPTLGFYDSSSPTVISSHIAAMQYGKMNAGIASWWGQGTQTDSRVAALENGAAGTGFKWSLYYEPEGQGDPTVAQIQSDTSYIASHYAADASYLHINSKPVIFVFADGADGCGMADRWKQANTGFYVVLKVFTGYAACASQPDNWHQYGPATATDEQTGHSYTISPGFFKWDESTARLARDTTRWDTNVKAMVASAEPFQLVTTFNEWGEGTAVESANEWSTASGYGTYLDTLHNDIP